MTGAVPLLPHIPSCCGKGHLYLYLYPLCYFVIVEELYLNLYAKCTGSLNFFNM